MKLLEMLKSQFYTQDDLFGEMDAYRWFVMAETGKSLKFKTNIFPLTNCWKQYMINLNMANSKEWLFQSILRCVKLNRIYL